MVVFMNTTGDVLNDQQQSAFQSWYQSGGAFLGVHAASDTEHEWDWFGQLVGARFRCHPAVQPARLVVMDHGHPATAHLGPTWVRTDEWYDFQSEGPHEGCNCLLRVDENTYSGGRTGPWHPMAWSHEFDGGRSFYTGARAHQGDVLGASLRATFAGWIGLAGQSGGEFTALGGQFCPRLPKRPLASSSFLRLGR